MPCQNLYAKQCTSLLFVRSSRTWSLRPIHPDLRRISLGSTRPPRDLGTLTEASHVVHAPHAGSPSRVDSGIFSCGNAVERLPRRGPIKVYRYAVHLYHLGPRSRHQGISFWQGKEQGDASKGFRDQRRSCLGNLCLCRARLTTKHLTHRRCSIVPVGDCSAECLYFHDRVRLWTHKLGQIHRSRWELCSHA